MAVLFVATACLMTMMIVSRRVHTATSEAMPALRGEEAVNYLKQQGLHTSLGEAIAAARYGVHWSKHTPWKELPGAFYAGNPAQQMTAFFTGEGIHLEAKSASDDKAKSASQDKWQMGMKLTGLGYGGRLLVVAAGEMKVNGNRVEIKKSIKRQDTRGASQESREESLRASDFSGESQDLGLTEWYVNRAEGIEQGFVINAAPGERREGEWLKLRLTLEGDLQAQLADDGEAVDLLTRGGERRLRYDKLHVTDATGRELAARMRVEGGEVMLEVEESEAVYPLTIDPVFSQQQKLTASDGAAGDQLGASVAISGETVVVGAFTDDVGANANQGSAYVFVRNGAVWSEQQKLTASDGAASDQLGTSVGISGETVVVGAAFDNVGANQDQGSAYIFVRNGAVWNEQQKLTASDGGVNGQFGTSAGISSETVVVGAALANSGQGSAYVFVRNGAVWNEQQKLIAADGATNDRFGFSIAIRGETVVVGAFNDANGANFGQGSAYIFVRNGAVWSEQQKLIASDGTLADSFGRSVGISGETVVVGAFNDTNGANMFQGSAYIFVRNGAVWSEQQKLTAADGATDDNFGASVAISGETVVVGAESDDVGANPDQGSAYIFVRSGAVWSQQQKLMASDGAANNNFGFSIAISGETVVVGAARDDVGANANQGSAYIFACTNTQQWVEQAKTTASDGAGGDEFGTSVAISGETVVVGAPADDVGANLDQGSAYVFVRVGAVWSQQQKLTASDGAAFDNFGFSVAISGETVVVGAPFDDVGANPDQGSAYVFVRTGAVWSQQQKLTAADGAVDDNFGASVGISGETLVVGAPADDVGANTNQGSAYIFVRNGAVWSEQQKLIASDGAAGDSFGTSVAISGETVVVGSRVDAVGANLDQGSAYIFVRVGAVWNEQQKLTASDGAASDQFGTSVGISGESVVVGAAFDNVGANNDQGSAYIFVRNGAVWSQQQKLTASDGAIFDNFGNSVAISGETVVVGAALGNVGANNNQGSAYVFVRVGAVWSEQQKLTASDGAAADFFGFSVTISGETVVVGSRFDDVGNVANQGSAYVFVRQCINNTNNTPPTITTSPVTLQQGQSLSGAGIATVSDNQDAASTLVVSVISSTTAIGVTLTNIANTSGAITANLAANCAASGGKVRLRVTDSGGLFTDTDLQVNVTPNNTPPVITCPVSLGVKTANPGSTTVVVNYPPPTATDDCGVPSVVCLPPSGSAFPLGTTTVTCTATDNTGNTAQCSFTVTTFDICLQDDSNPATVLLLNSLTGDYRFCCSGTVFAGKGKVKKQGSTCTLTHNAVDRRVIAKLEGALNRGTASLQSPVGTTRCAISDRDIRNNSCVCQ